MGAVPGHSGASGLRDAGPAAVTISAARLAAAQPHRGRQPAAAATLLAAAAPAAQPLPGEGFSDGSTPLRFLECHEA